MYLLVFGYYWLSAITSTVFLPLPYTTVQYKLSNIAHFIMNYNMTCLKYSVGMK